jgi:hypothetical protein
MPLPLNDADSVIITLAFAAFSVAVFTVLTLLRKAHSRRMAVLAEAESLLNEHFKAAHTIIEDPATPEVVADVVRLFSISVGRRSVARAVAMDILSDRTAGRHAAQNAPMLDDFSAKVRLLRLHRPDLAKNISVASGTGFMAMMLRWPETGDAAVHVVSRQAREEELPDPRRRFSEVLEAASARDAAMGCAA